MIPVLVRFDAKHSDLVSVALMDADENTLKEFDSGESIGIFGGDYTTLVIENETGRILDWEPIELVSDDN